MVLQYRSVVKWQISGEFSGNLIRIVILFEQIYNKSFLMVIWSFGVSLMNKYFDILTLENLKMLHWRSIDIYRVLYGKKFNDYLPKVIKNKNKRIRNVVL